MNLETLMSKQRVVQQFSVVLRPRRWHFAAVILLILVTSLLEGISFSLIVPLTQAFTSNEAGGSTVSPLFLAYQGWLAEYPVERRLAILGVALIALFGLKNGLQYLREMLSTRLWLGIGADIRSRAMAYALRQPYRCLLYTSPSPRD